MRVCAVNGTKVGVGQFVQLAPAQAVFFLGQHDNAAAFRRFVGERRELRGFGHRFLRHARRGKEFRGLAIAERDRAGLVEQQHIHVAGGFDRASAHREHVLLHETIDARDADGAQQAANGRRNEADEQRDEHRDREIDAAVDAERLHRHEHDEEDDRQRGEQDGQRDFVRRLLAFRAFDQADHAIEEGLAGIRGDADFDHVGKHARAAGDRAAIAAGFADDRRGFAGDGRFVHGRRAFDDLAVAGDELAGFHDNEIAFAQLARRALPRVAPSLRKRFAFVSVRALRNVSAWALPRPSAIASAKFAKSTVNQSQSVIWSRKPNGRALPAGEEQRRS